MNTLKYAVYPGYVISKNDGDRHYISARQLAELYRVPLRDCLIVLPESTDNQKKADALGLVKLRPRYDGKYEKPVEPVPLKEEPKK